MKQEEIDQKVKEALRNLSPAQKIVRRKFLEDNRVKRSQYQAVFAETMTGLRDVPDSSGRH